MAYVAPTPADLKRRYAAFTSVDDDQIEYWLNDALRFVDASWIEDDRAVAEMAYRQREQNVRSLADIYRTAFEGGAKGIGEALKEALLNAIATALARQTVGAFASFLGGGSSGGIFSSIFGRASGGYAAPRSLHRVNETAGGVELLRMGPTGGEVIPLGRAQASHSGGGTTVLQTIAVDARGAVMNDQFARLILNQADQNARQITAVGSKAAYEASPDRLQRQNLLGT